MVVIFDRLDAFDVLALGGRRLWFFYGFLKYESKELSFNVISFVIDITL